jgi:hypothetical protein
MHNIQRYNNIAITTIKYQIYAKGITPTLISAIQKILFFSLVLEHTNPTNKNKRQWTL